ncbi:MAG: glycosyltransferase family 4 protein [Candidatus Binatia bacterium]
MKGALVICPASPGTFNGVGDYSYWLASALRSHLPAFLVNTQNGAQEAGTKSMVSQRVCLVRGWYELWRSRHASPFGESEALLLQYVPQMYFPARDLGWLFLWLAHARLRQGKKLVVTVHEYDVSWRLSLKRIVARMVLNLLMMVLAFFSDVIVVTHGAYLRKLRRILFWKRDNIYVIPVGSNIPLSVVSSPLPVISWKGEGASDNSRRVERGQHPTFLTIFGQPAGMDHRLLSSVGTWIVNQRLPLRIRWIGRSRDEILDLWCRRCGFPADLLEIWNGEPAGSVSRLLQTSALFLAPLVDGVSTRRTTVIAALAHGLPIVGTDGPCTDPLFREDGSILLSACGDGEAFVKNVDLLFKDEPRRKLMGRAARDLFTGFFTWERIAGEYWQLLRAQASKDEVVKGA